MTFKTKMYSLIITKQISIRIITQIKMEQHPRSFLRPPPNHLSSVPQRGPLAIFLW